MSAQQKPEATNVAGFRTWSSLGRFVRRGEKGILILAPLVGRKAKADQKLTGEGAPENDGKNTPAQLYGFRAVYVFDITQTEGKDLPALTEVQGDVSGYRERLVKFVAAQNIELHYSDKIGPAKAVATEDPQAQSFNLVNWAVDSVGRRHQKAMHDYHDLALLKHVLSGFPTTRQALVPIRRQRAKIKTSWGFALCSPILKFDLHAVIVLAEELNFTRAAYRLHISQPALSRQISELEELHRLRLFVHEKGRQVQLTDAGRVFVEEARSALFHAERAIHLAHAAHDGSDDILLVGHSPQAIRYGFPPFFSIRLPLFPKLRVRLVTRFALELVRGVLAGDLNLAIVMAPPEDAQITMVPFARSPLYAAVPESHPAAHKDSIALKDLAKDEWILFAKQVHPLIHDAILEGARREVILLRMLMTSLRWSKVFIWCPNTSESPFLQNLLVRDLLLTEF